MSATPAPVLPLQPGSEVAIADLLELIRAIDSLQPASAPPVLQPQEIHAHPRPLALCREVWMHKRDARKALGGWSVEQKRTPGKEYIRVYGRKEWSGGKKIQSTLPWPRRRRGGKKGVYLHHAICAAVWGKAPSSGHHASHVCGNAACVSAAHIRWQSVHENVTLDSEFHQQQYSAQYSAHVRPTERYSRREWNAWE